ncbi:hypothetical protein BABINDRAFT_161908 [Babjeviella inositovora NRRL Y-12698]|uniref:Uncharacterized protein n=1 Tax=Babjeviella inositovora NRRL Y-12698 TaxID=984486 RepID=A0A1E3QRE5_9ASCO|nr:uncharacterized protein BABINDRAFT_161908 [Babjeviella inositovora NRRL Y-12698]ODQ79517.1 hypothetical protein BABINDRAFT_161908 [Babjeviella inositovora NRRL Y-12698]
MHGANHAYQDSGCSQTDKSNPYRATPELGYLTMVPRVIAFIVMKSLCRSPTVLVHQLGMARGLPCSPPCNGNALHQHMKFARDQTLLHATRVSFNQGERTATCYLG